MSDTGKSCNHDIKYLMGTADGILCRSCGRLFASMDEVLAERGDGSAVPDPDQEHEQVTEEKPKRGRKKKGE